MVGKLLTLTEAGGHITKTSDYPSSSRGLPYYFVEITFNDGKQFVIQAYEEEAISLFESTTKILENEKSQ